jgi:hypothetical protein
MARMGKLFTPAQLVCKWHEQRPSNQGDLDLIFHGGDWESVP